MANVHDVAAYILKKAGRTSAMKLQKLVYYSQAWSLVWDEKPLFRARIEAWANGPVVPELYKEHKGQFQIDRWPKGDESSLDGDERGTVDSVLGFYGDKPPYWLSQLTHRESPWSDARKGVPTGEPSNVVITHEAMSDYYSSLLS